MTISSSLNAGVTGLNVNATRLATIADNIANSATYGYRRATVDFSSLVINDTPGTYTAGGVRANAGREVDERGAIVATNNATDLAVAGRGMFPVTQITDVRNGGELPLSLVPTGSFRADEEGYLRNSAGLVLLGWQAEVDGTVPSQPRDGTTGLEPVRVLSNQELADPTTNVSLGVNLPAAAAADAVTAAAPGDPLTVPVVYYDNVGTAQTLTATFTPTGAAADEWSLTFDDSASSPARIGEFSVTFDASRGSGGSIASVTPVSGGTYDAATGDLSLNVAGGPMTVAIGSPGGSELLTQLSSEFAPTAVTTNGAPVGTLARVEVDENGFMSAIYDTGFSRTLYQIPLADVANLNGLNAESGQSYTVTRNSGPVYLWDAGDGPTGGVVGFALEESTADIAGELTQMIQTQRAYSSNAKVIQTVDEMLQETTNIIR
ncbi:MAG: flagellar hook-basal body complex protein [Pseudomonadota bacterium]